MTAPPAVLVDVYSSEHHFIPLPQDIQAHMATPIQMKTQAIRQPSVSTSSPPGSPIAEPPRGELTSTCVFGSHASSWSYLLSNRQGVLPGPTDGYEIPNSLHFLELIGVSLLSTPH